MPLRDASLAGLGSPLDVSGVVPPEAGPADTDGAPGRSVSADASDVAAQAEPAVAGEDAPKTRRRARTSTRRVRPDATPAAAASPRPGTAAVPDGGVPAADGDRADVEALALFEQPRRFVQVEVTAGVHQRLADAAHALKHHRPALQHQKTIVGALIWRYVRPGGPRENDALLALVYEWSQDPLSREPGETRLGMHLPTSLWENLDNAAHARGPRSARASKKAIISALLWRHVPVVDPFATAFPRELGALVELLVEYEAAIAVRRVPGGAVDDVAA